VVGDKIALKREQTVGEMAMEGFVLSDLTAHRAVPAEAGHLSDLAWRSKQSNGYDAEFMAACREELAVSPEAIFDGGVWIGENRGKLVGFFHLTLENDKVELEAMFVEPECQGAGAGKFMWKALERQANAMGARSIELDADPFAVPFYQAMGCEVIGKVPSGSISGRMLPRMRKWL
jgi:GNAT superfamily N-acetyltransferase